MSCMKYVVLSIRLRSYNVEADEHPCQLVVKYMATSAESFDLLMNNVTAWLEGRGMP